MQYLVICFTIPEENQDFLVAILSTIGFDGFQQETSQLKAYISQENFHAEELNKLLNNSPVFEAITYEIEELENKNWNQIWESGFQEIVFDKRLTVRASFHKEPLEGMDIIIDPKMAFGTGHHATTFMILEWMLEHDFAGENVLDWGAGSGILSILASKLNCRDVIALEIDATALQTLQLNCNENKCLNISSYLDESQIDLNRKFDTVLMNITKNTILSKLDVIEGLVSPQGNLILSGFYVGDIEEMVNAFEAKGFSYNNFNEKDKWACLIFQKRNND